MELREEMVKPCVSELIFMPVRRGLHTLSSETTTHSQTMSLLVRAPRLAARSARSKVLVQSRGMHGEYKVRLSYNTEKPSPRS